jgi:putative protein kinase ArgK-like GTPase of G3E family
MLSTFLGRRREQQQLLPALRAGDLQAVVLTGLGGAGKSTLATRLARKLQADGWRPLAVPSSAETPLSAGRLLQVLGEALYAVGDHARHATLMRPETTCRRSITYLTLPETALCSPTGSTS